MKKISVAFINGLERARKQTFMDSFVDYLEEVYYPGAYAKLDDATVSFELREYSKNYAK